jgi:hypothetical protein
VRIFADDYGQDVVEGHLLTLDARSVAILRENPLAGRVVNHFPRIGFRVLPAEGRRHFAGDIRPR